MKGIKEENGQYFGQRGNEFYLINDTFAPYFYEQWHGVTITNVGDFVKKTLGYSKLWDKDLTKFSGFTEAITDLLKAMMHNGVKAVLNEQMA